MKTAIIFPAAVLALVIALGFSKCEDENAPEFRAENVKSFNKTYTAYAVGCFDGDGPTLRVPLDTALGTDTTYRMRLYGIDSPEHNHLYVTKKQPGSDLAADSLRKFIRGKNVRVEIYYVDDFNRQCGRLFVQDTIDLSLWMLQKGYTWARNEPNQPRTERDYFKSLQFAARDSGIGIWALEGRKYRPDWWRKTYSSHQMVVDRY